MKFAARLLAIALVFGLTSTFAQEKVIPFYEGPIPGSENWTHTEKTLEAPGLGTLWYDVARPTLTPFPADPARATGTAVIICPGGAFVALAYEHEGAKVARELNAKGITCFALKYRLVQCKTGSPGSEMAANPNLDPLVAPIYPAYKWVPRSKPLPADAPPLFLMSATDDPATGPDQILAM